MDFIVHLLASIGLGYLMFTALKAVVALGYRNAHKTQERVDAEIDRLHN